MNSYISNINVNNVNGYLYIDIKQLCFIYCIVISF